MTCIPTLNSVDVCLIEAYLKCGRFDKRIPREFDNPIAYQNETYDASACPPP